MKIKGIVPGSFNGNVAELLVKPEIQALGLRERDEEVARRLKTADNKIKVTVVRADDEVCAATIRFTDGLTRLRLEKRHGLYWERVGSDAIGGSRELWG